MAAEDGRLNGKVALVTGAVSDIGEATAWIFAAEGATVIVSDVRLDAAEKVVVSIRESDGNAEAVALDVTNETAWPSVISGIFERHRKLDVLVNNAGMSDSRWRSTTGGR